MTAIVLDPIVLVACLAVVGVVTPLGGFLAWRTRKPRRRRQWLRQPLFWIAAGSGPLLALMWLCFQAIVGYFGLDSLLGLVVALAVFAVAGAALGATARRGMQARKRNE